MPQVTTPTTSFFIQKKGDATCPVSRKNAFHDESAFVLSYVCLQNVQLQYCSKGFTESVSTLCHNTTGVIPIDTFIAAKLLKTENFFLDLLERSPARKTAPAIILLTGTKVQYEGQEWIVYLEYQYPETTAYYGIVPITHCFEKRNIFKLVYKK